MPDLTRRCASRFVTCLFLAGSFVLVAPLAANSNDGQGIERWRGHQGSGVFEGSGFPMEWSLETLKWKVPLPGTGLSSPVLAGGRIFVTAQIEGDVIPGAAAPNHTFNGEDFKHPQALGADKHHDLIVLAVDAETGQIAWQRTAYSGRMYDDRHKDSSYAAPTCAVDDERVYAYFGSEGVYAYDHDGELVWQRDIGDIKTVGLGVGSSPILWGELVILLADEDSGEDSFLTALNRRTGEEVWRVARDVQVSWGTPMVVERDGKAQLITVGNEYILSYDPATGREIWRTDGLASNAIHSPLLHDDLVIISSGYPTKTIFALPLDLEGDLTGQDVSLWRYNKGSAYMPSNVVIDGRLHMISDQGVMTILDASNGEVVVEGGRPPEGGRYMASLVAADGKILQINRDGDATWTAAGDSYEVLHSASLDEAVGATPTIVGNRIYVRSAGHLWAFGE